MPDYWPRALRRPLLSLAARAFPRRRRSWVTSRGIAILTPSFSALAEGAAGKSHAGNAGGKAQVILDPRRRSRRRPARRARSPTGPRSPRTRPWAFGLARIGCLGQQRGLQCSLADGSLIRPWQSYRQGFRAHPEWETVQLLFEHFVPHRTEVALDTHRLKRIGVVAIGRAFSADLYLGGLRLMA